MGNIIKKESMESVEIFILAPGVGSQDVKVSADKESSNLYVEASPETSGVIEEETDLGFEHTIAIDKKYDVATATVSVHHGIVRIRVASDSERILNIHPASSDN